MENIKPFKMPKISVIITCYNLGVYVKECIESVLNQKYKNFELIIVNDCSTDNSKEIIEQYSDSAKIINLEKNLGQFGAFLEGLKKAEGEFVCMIDADDILLPDFLSVHIQVHMQTSVAFTSCAQFEIDDNSTIISLNSLASPEFKNSSYEDKIKTLDEVTPLMKAIESGVNSGLVIMVISLGVAIPNIFGRRYIASSKNQHLKELLAERKAKGQFIEW